MDSHNVETNSQLDALADICCQALEGEQPVVSDRTEKVLKSLLMSGYARQEGVNLRAEIETRVKSKCREPAMHRGGALSSLTEKIQQKFNDLKRWESTQPERRTDPKAANISSATDA